MSDNNSGAIVLQILDTTDSLHRSTWVHNLFYLTQERLEFTKFQFCPSTYGPTSRQLTRFIARLDNADFISVEWVPLQPLRYAGRTIGGDREFPMYKLTEKGEKTLEAWIEDHGDPIPPRLLREISRHTDGRLMDLVTGMGRAFPEMFTSSSPYCFK